MQTTFCFCKSTPPSRPFVFTQQNGSRARLATDARIALIVQRIVGDIVVGNEFPDLPFRPVREWADFNEVKLVVPSDNRCLSTIWALISSDG